MSSENNETRTRILKAAWELLEASKGRDVRMSDIAKKAKVSRQALYLHFKTRADLLIETTLYVDGCRNTDARLDASRIATTGIERLDAFVEAWGNYIPEIYGVGKALLAMMEEDDDAATAWTKRMQDMKEGCAAAIQALSDDGRLDPMHTVEGATDVLWTLLSVRNWEHLTQDCNWSQVRYVKSLKEIMHRLFVLKN